MSFLTDIVLCKNKSESPELEPLSKSLPYQIPRIKIGSLIRTLRMELNRNMIAKEGSFLTRKEAVSFFLKTFFTFHLRGLKFIGESQFPFATATLLFPNPVS